MTWDSPSGYGPKRMQGLYCLKPALRAGMEMLCLQHRHPMLSFRHIPLLEKPDHKDAQKLNIFDMQAKGKKEEASVHIKAAEVFL